jgi:DNA-binding response OmpR family regulator
LEDDANDALLIRRAFTNAACRAFVCRNTSEARAYLVGAGMYGDREAYPFPDIFITDIHLGDESGMSFLEWLRTNETFKSLPAIILSGSCSPADQQRAKKLGISRFIAKPSNPAELHLIILKLSRQFCPRKSEHVSVANRQVELRSSP